MRKILLASHGELSKGMLNSIQMIVGDIADGIETYCLNLGESPVDYCKEIESKISTSQDQYIIVCDVKGGSVHTAFSKLMIYPNVVVISGMNMNILLELVLTYQDEIREEDYINLLNSAIDGITVLSGTIIEKEDEDF